ncbi:MAG: hypothetical protein AAFR87_10735 [Bacteroidota bacterium]
MGTRLTFSELPKDDLKKVLYRDLDDFISWYEPLGNQYPVEIDYDLLERLYELSNSSAPEESDASAFIDTWGLEYLGSYCDFGSPGKIKSVPDSTALNIRYYESERRIISSGFDREILQLWDFMILGRSLAQKERYISNPDVFRFAQFSEGECQKLHSTLADAFDVSTSEKFNKTPAIGSVIRAMQDKKWPGLLVMVA